MANTITKRTIVDGDRNLVVHIHIDGDGSGEETDTVLIDASSYTPAFTDCKLMKIDAALIGFSIELNWDATANVIATHIPDYEFHQDFRWFGGIPNDAGAGRTGDLLITTTGLGANDHGDFVLFLKKVGIETA